MNFSLSPVFCAHNGVVLLEQYERTLVVGMLNVDNMALRSKIALRYEQFLRQKNDFDTYQGDMESCITYKSITKDFFIRKTSGEFVRSQENTLVSIENNDVASNRFGDVHYLIEDAPIIHLLNSLILECIEKKGSDIHIEPYKFGCRIKMRTFGELELYSTIDLKTSEAVLLRILFLAGLDISEKRRVQDGSFHFEAGSVECEIRVSVLPAQFGLSCVLRILHSKNFDLSFFDLGFSPCHIDFLDEACQKNNSLVLVCGATGAGKSTTLAAMLHVLVGQRKKIISIEDPVEYCLDGVVQLPVDLNVNMDFPNLLRSTFRHDPDVIMIGEIRDEKTARIAVRSALTGHLVFASLHTIDAPSAIMRLLDMGIEPWLLASVFGGSICQRLVKKHFDGKEGYLPVAEVLPACTDIASLIVQNSSLHEYRNWMEENNLASMRKEECYATCI